MYKILWIVNSNTSDHTTNAHNLFTFYSLCAVNFKVKVTNESLNYSRKREYLNF